MKRKLVRQGYLYIGYGLVLLSTIITADIDVHNLPIALIGLMLTILGAVLAMLASKIWSKSPPLPGTSDIRFVESGLYRTVRHPIYIGRQFICWGIALIAGSVPALIIASFIVLPIHIIRGYEEEKILSREMGNQFEKYRDDTLL